MRLAEYDKMMEEKGTPKVWVVNSAFFGGNIYSALFLTEERGKKEV